MEVGVDVVVVAVVRGADMDMGERRVRSIRVRDVPKSCCTKENHSE